MKKINEKNKIYKYIGFFIQLEIEINKLNIYFMNKEMIIFKYNDIYEYEILKILMLEGKIYVNCKKNKEIITFIYTIKNNNFF